MAEGVTHGHRGANRTEGIATDVVACTLEDEGARRQQQSRQPHAELVGHVKIVADGKEESPTPPEHAVLRRDLVKNLDVRNIFDPGSGIEHAIAQVELLAAEKQTGVVPAHRFEYLATYRMAGADKARRGETLIRRAPARVIPGGMVILAGKVVGNAKPDRAQAGMFIEVGHGARQHVRVTKNGIIVEGDDVGAVPIAVAMLRPPATPEFAGSTFRCAHGTCSRNALSLPRL